MSQTQDPTFYRTQADAIAAPPERLAYVAAYDPAGRSKDAMAVVDCDPVLAELRPDRRLDRVAHRRRRAAPLRLERVLERAVPHGPRHHGAPLERRYLIVPGLPLVAHLHRRRQGRPAPAHGGPQIIGPTSSPRARPATRVRTPFHCGPDGLYASALGAPDGRRPRRRLPARPRRLRRPRRQWEVDRGPQELAYDIWWNIGFDRIVTSEWGTPNMVEAGVNPELLLGGKYGHHLHIWDMRKRTPPSRPSTSGRSSRWCSSCGRAHDPNKPWGFVGVVVSTADLSASVWLWHPEDGNGKIAATKVIEIPAEPAETEQLPPALQPFGAVPPLVTDISLTGRRQALLVSCWGTGELKRYDVTDPFHPRETGSVRLGGIVERAPHPSARQAQRRAADGRGQPRRQARVPHELALRELGRAVLPRRGSTAWMVKLDADLDSGGLVVDARFFPNGNDFRGLRVHQTRLAGERLQRLLLLHRVTAVALPDKQPIGDQGPCGGSRH